MCTYYLIKKGDRYLYQNRCDYGFNVDRALTYDTFDDARLELDNDSEHIVKVSNKEYQMNASTVITPKKLKIKKQEHHNFPIDTISNASYTYADNMTDEKAKEIQTLFEVKSNNCCSNCGATLNYEHYRCQSCDNVIDRFLDIERDIRRYASLHHKGATISKKRKKKKVWYRVWLKNRI